MRLDSDQALISKVQQGSLEALGVLYDRHRRMVYRTALAITSDPEAADDLLQDVFLRVYRFADRMDTSRPLEPWLYRITANLSYTWVKRRNRWFHPIEDLAEWLTGSKKQYPQYLAELDEETQIIQQAITMLPLPQRVVIALYYVNDLSLQEISEILEVPEGTIKSRLHYGRKTLKRHLNQQGEALSEVCYEFT